MSTIAAPRRPRQPASPATIAAIAWHSLLKSAEKKAVRDDLPAGSAHSINLAVSGDIDGQPFERTIAGLLTVGHDSQKASSANPPLKTLIGHMLTKMNRATRNAELRDILALYAANGNELPEVPKEIEAETEAFLKALRAQEQVKVRGSVKYLPATDDADQANGEAAREFAVVG